MQQFKFLKWIFSLVIIFNANTMNAQINKPLTEKEKALASISALTATGDMENLTVQLNKGLDAGLTVNEAKEALVHLYAYIGFPRSLNALTALMQVVEERKIAGKKDVEGRDASPLPKDKSLLELGTEVQTQLVGQPVSGGVMAFAPAIDQFLKEHLLGAIFARDILTHQQRELVTVSALAAMEGVGAQLQSHFSVAMNTGLTKNQLEGILDVVEKNIGKEQADKGRALLSNIKSK